MGSPTRVILGITGASGVLYGLRSLEKLVHLADEIQVIASANVQDIIRTELDDHAPTIEAFRITDVTRKRWVTLSVLTVST